MSRAPTPTAVAPVADTSARGRRHRAAAAAMLAAAIVAGGWLRVAPIAERPLWYDEAYTWFTADPGTWQAWLRWQSREPKHPPLSFMLASAAMTVLDSEEPWAVRVPAVVCGILLIPAMFVLGAAAFGPLAGGAAALLTAFAPDLVDQGQQARMYPLLALAETLALALAIRLLDYERERRRGVHARSVTVLPPAAPPAAPLGWSASFAAAWQRAGRGRDAAARHTAAVRSAVSGGAREVWRDALDWWAWIVLGLLLAVALWTNHLALALWAGIPSAVVAAAFADPWLRSRETWSRLAPRMAAGLLVAVLASHVGIALIAHDLLAGTHLPEGGSIELGAIAREVRSAALLVLGGVPGAVLALPLAALGWLVLLRRRRAAGLILGAVGAAAVVILFPMRQRHPFLAPRFLTAAEPVLWVCVAVAAVAAVSSTWVAARRVPARAALAGDSSLRRIVRLLPAAAAAVLLGILLYRSLDPLGSMKAADRFDLAEATVKVVERVEDGDFVAFHPEFNRIVGHYYGLAANHPLHAALYRDADVQRPETLGAVQRPRRLWLVGSMTKRSGRGARWLSEQRNEIAAFARWYGHAALGREVAAAIRPGDTYVVLFDPQTVSLEVTHRRSR